MDKVVRSTMPRAASSHFARRGPFMVFIALVCPLTGHADNHHERRTFGVKIETVPARTNPGATQAPLVEASPQVVTTTDRFINTPPPLGGGAINKTTLQTVKRQLDAYNMTQTLILFQCLALLWGLSILFGCLCFNLDRCGVWDDGEREDNTLAGPITKGACACCGKPGRRDCCGGLSRIGVCSTIVVVLLTLVTTVGWVYLSRKQKPPPWFIKLENVETSFINSVFHLKGTVPAPAPAPAPAQVATTQPLATIATTVAQVATTLPAVTTVAQSSQAQAAARAKVTPPSTAPASLTTTLGLNAKLAKLKAKAMAKTTTAAASGGGSYGMSQPDSGYGTTPAPVVTPAPVAPAMASPCTTMPPPTPVQGPPKIQNFVPPPGCNCKAAVGNGRSYKAHCSEYAGDFASTPVCVVDNPACTQGLLDADLGTADKLAKCVVSTAVPTTYTVMVDKTQQHDLGINIVADTGMNKLIVTAISPTGLITSYNQQHPGLPQVKKGDKIFAVNGQQGTSVVLLNACMKNTQLTLSMEHQPGYPIAASAPAVSAMNPATFPTGQCPSTGHNWGLNSACLNNNPSAGFPPPNYLWHCPWESMMLVSSKKYGGCDGVKYDCQGTNFAQLLKLYGEHDTNGTNHPPEGSLQTVEYVACCIRHQCQNGPVCGPGPWIEGQSVSPWVGMANPCGAAGCERRYSVSHVLKLIPKAARHSSGLAAMGLLLLAAMLLAIRRRGSGTMTQHLAVAQEDVEAVDHGNEGIE